MREKPIVWIGAALSEVRAFPVVARRRARFEEAIYVLHAFPKKSRKTPKKALDIARLRLAAVIAERKRGGDQP